MTVDPTQAIANYGLAGLVILLFWQLMRSDLKALKTSVDELKDKITALRVDPAGGE